MSSLAHGRVTLLRDQLNALSTQTTSFSNVFKSTLKRVGANISDLVENVMGPMGQKKVRRIYFPIFVRLYGGSWNNLLYLPVSEYVTLSFDVDGS